MKKTVIMRVDKDFYDFTNNLSKDLSTIHNKSVKATDVTGNLSNFMKNEGVDIIIKRRAKRRNGGFFF